MLFLACPRASFKLKITNEADWAYSNYRYRHKKDLNCAAKKTYGYGIRVLNFLDNI